MGRTGMMKKSVTKRIPFLPVKLAVAPHRLQCIIVGVGCAPHVMKRVLMIKMKNNFRKPPCEKFESSATKVALQRLAARDFFDDLPPPDALSFVCVICDFNWRKAARPG